MHRERAESAITRARLREVVGAVLRDRAGEVVGEVTRVYLDDASGRPSWLRVDLKGSGDGERLVPVDGAQLAAGSVQVPHERSHVVGAPPAGEQDHLDVEEEDELHRWYGGGAVQPGPRGRHASDQPVDAGGAERTAGPGRRAVGAASG